MKYYSIQKGMEIEQQRPKFNISETYIGGMTAIPHFLLINNQIL